MGEGLQRAFAAAHGIAVGQIWQDWDIRRQSHPRLLRVMGFGYGAGKDLRAHCMVIQTGRMVWIKASRLKPTATGYRLIGTDEEMARTGLTVQQIQEASK